jgi:uncharacterized membrane protein
MVKIIAWVGTAASIAGSFIVALQFFLLGYSLFMLGSLSWLTVSIIRRDKALGVLNGTFFLANILGLWKAL